MDVPVEQEGRVDVLAPGESTPEEWAERITTAWRESVAGIIEVGRLLIAAKEALQHGEFGAMFDELPFSRKTGHMLMAIARDARIANVQISRQLPASWYSLYQISTLDDDQFERARLEGVISPDAKGGAISAFLRSEKRSADEANILSIKPVAGKYRTIMIDPPWDHYTFSLAGRGLPNYATLSQDDLLDGPENADTWIPDWADDQCHLYLWVTNNFLTRGVDLVRHWGFDHRTVITWVKPRFGLGSYFRSSTEHMLFATKGDVLTTRVDDIPSHFEAPLGEHSAKPERAYEIAELASYPMRLDVFFGKPRDGWDAWGPGR